MAEFSVGEGLGLSGKPDNFGYSQLSRGIAALHARPKAKDDSPLFKSVLDEVKPSGVHQLDVEDSKRNMADFVDFAINERRQNPNNWLPTVEAKARQAAFNQAQFAQRNDELKKAEQLYEAQKAANAITTPAQDELYKILKQGKWNDVANFPADPEGSVVVNPKSKQIQMNLIPNVDTSLLEKTAVNNPGFQTDIKTERDKTYRDLKGGTKDNIYYSVPDAKVEQQATILASDNNYIRKKVHELRQANKLPENFFSLPHDQKDAILFPIIKEDVRKQAPVKIEPKYNEPFAPKASQADDNSDEGVTKDLAFSAGDKTLHVMGAGTKEGQVSKTPVTYTAKGYKSFTTKKVTTALPAGTIGAESGKPVNEGGVAKELEISAAQNIPIIQVGPNKGHRATDDYINSLKKQGENLSSHIKYETYAPAASTTQEAQTVDGKTSYKTVRTEYQVPIKGVAGSLESGKQPAKLKALVDRANAMNEELKASYLSPAKQESKKDWTKYKRK